MSRRFCGSAPKTLWVLDVVEGNASNTQSILGVLPTGAAPGQDPTPKWAPPPPPPPPSTDPKMVVQNNGFCRRRRFCFRHMVGGNHLEERLLDQAQVRASYTPLFWGSFT